MHRESVQHGSVVIACCRRTRQAGPTDLYPDPDAGPLSQALSALGAAVELVSWDDPDIDWSRFDRVVVSSTWDSVDRPDRYLDWAARTATSTRLVNPEPVLRLGLDKTHQRHLAAAGIPVVPTIWVAPGHTWEPPAGEFVVKPAVSAGARSTARYLPGDLEAARAHVAVLHRAGQTVMVQPYLATIDRAGEADLVYLAGRYSHAVRKLPGLPPGRLLGERPWEQTTWAGLLDPDPVQLDLAATVVELAARLAGAAPIYARVDLVPAPDGTPLLLELEVVDPYLSLDTHPPAAHRLAQAVLDA